MNVIGFPRTARWISRSAALMTAESCVKIETCVDNKSKIYSVKSVKIYFQFNHLIGFHWGGCSFSRHTVRWQVQSRSQGFLLDGQTRWAKSSLQMINLPSAHSILKPLNYLFFHPCKVVAITYFWFQFRWHETVRGIATSPRWLIYQSMMYQLITGQSSTTLCYLK